MKISLCVNVDTRKPKDTADGLFSGVVNEDFLEDGIRNKQLFFNGFDLETIVFVDKHNEIPDSTLKYLHQIVDTVCVRKHTSEESFNDYNYLSALALCRGEIICHADQDTSMFTSGKEYVEELISHLDTHKFVSYPSAWSPRAIDDPTFGKRTWASTRFFLCKREAINLEELRQCIIEPEYAYNKYGDSPRRCNWLEHYLTLCNNDSCYYPPIEADKGLIFSWGKYEKYVLKRLNEYTYDELKNWVAQRGIHYPVDVDC